SKSGNLFCPQDKWMQQLMYSHDERRFGIRCSIDDEVNGRNFMPLFPDNDHANSGNVGYDEEVPDA
ncbi:MAG: hypothetical protein QMD80_06255, partial [archaeon]|nr:hypothetical protein [archaeon]